MIAMIEASSSKLDKSDPSKAFLVQPEIPTILQFGTEEQKQKYLAPVLKGEKIASLGITEPDAGSDVAFIQTRATREGEG